MSALLIGFVLFYTIRRAAATADAPALRKPSVWPATLYAVLQKMIAGGLIEESGERPAPELDDARRRYYKLTPIGRKVLDLECERLRDMLRMAQRKRRQEAY